MRSTGISRPRRTIRQEEFQKVSPYNIVPEQKARLTYDNILRFADDPDVRDPIKFLREREVVHYQRFGEALRIATDRLDSKNFYAFNPSFDRKCK